MPLVLILPFLLYLLFFNSQYQELTAATIKKTAENAVRPSIHLDGHYIWKTNKKAPTRVFNKELQLLHLKKLTENFYKNKKQVHDLFSKSWGAGGMPFNVLYTPNSHQQKIMKATPRKTFNSTAKKINNLNDVRKDKFKFYSSVLKNQNSLFKTKEKIYKKHLTPKKYYSLIPQLFVSYGW